MSSDSQQQQDDQEVLIEAKFIFRAMRRKDIPEVAALHVC